MEVNIELLKKLVKEYPNDYDLGEAIRRLVNNEKDEDSFKKMKDRIKWLMVQLIHEDYYDGYSLKAFKTELNNLLKKINDK